MNLNIDISQKENPYLIVHYCPKIQGNMKKFLLDKFSYKDRFENGLYIGRSFTGANHKSPIENAIKLQKKKTIGVLKEEKKDNSTELISIMWGGVYRKASNN